jgi:hypothetical protein
VCVLRLLQKFVRLGFCGVGVEVEDAASRQPEAETKVCEEKRFSLGDGGMWQWCHGPGRLPFAAGALNPSLIARIEQSKIIVDF